MNTTLGVFKEGKINSTLTPINRKFAPGYFSTHSLIANAHSVKADISIKNDKQQILNQLVPQNM
jgi:hypothetical protein